MSVYREQGRARTGDEEQVSVMESLERLAEVLVQLHVPKPSPRPMPRMTHEMLERLIRSMLSLDEGSCVVVRLGALRASWHFQVAAGRTGEVTEGWIDDEVFSLSPKEMAKALAEILGC